MCYEESLNKRQKATVEIASRVTRGHDHLKLSLPRVNTDWNHKSFAFRIELSSARDSDSQVVYDFFGLLSQWMISECIVMFEILYRIIFLLYVLQ